MVSTNGNAQINGASTKTTGTSANKNNGNKIRRNTVMTVNGQIPHSNGL